jgi:outer membrane lipoprotein SlyB
MNTTRILQVATLTLSTVLAACATTQTTSATWPDPNGRPGEVEGIQEVVRRTEGQPVLGEVAGALIGGVLLGGRGGNFVAGAAEGAAVGGAVSSGSSESRTYNLIIRFDDGGHGTFSYADYSPFRPGERVVWTVQGLLPG